MFPPTPEMSWLHADQTLVLLADLGQWSPLLRTLASEKQRTLRSQNSVYFMNFHLNGYLDKARTFYNV